MRCSSGFLSRTTRRGWASRHRTPQHFASSVLAGGITKTAADEIVRGHRAARRYRSSTSGSRADEGVTPQPRSIRSRRRLRSATSGLVRRGPLSVSPTPFHASQALLKLRLGSLDVATDPAGQEWEGWSSTSTHCWSRRASCMSRKEHCEGRRGSNYCCQELNGECSRPALSGAGPPQVRGQVSGFVRRCGRLLAWHDV